jgi:hypothetical protein
MAEYIVQWLLEKGIPVAAEFLLVWGLGCMLIACTGSGKWLERGAKSIIIAVLLGVVNIAT